MSIMVMLFHTYAYSIGNNAWIEQRAVNYVCLILESRKRRNICIFRSLMILYQVIECAEMVIGASN